MPDPELTLQDVERAELKACVMLRGFEQVKRLAEAECARFDVQLKNLSPEAPNYDSTLKQYHALAKAASQFWVGLVERINLEIARLDMQPQELPDLKTLKPEDIAEDPTAELLEG